MPTTIIHTSSSRLEIRRIIKSVPRILSGREVDSYRLHNRFWGAVALSMFESFNKAFIEKSEGRTDDLGNSWEDILPHTKAYSRSPGKGDLTRSQVRTLNRPDTLGLLSPNQYKQWKKLFGAVYYRERGRIGEAAAKELAGQHAWAEMKRRGASTKIDLLGNRDLLILRDTDKLFRSFLPGTLTKSTGYRKFNRDQVYVVRSGEITIGTSLDYASDVFDDRPLWTKDISPWIRKASKAGMKRIIEYLTEILT